ncbi:MAG: protease pro-enzyme activation domain-containing protein [Bryobacteraceae bacterium]
MERAAIAGSAPDNAGYRRVGAADPATPVEVAIVLRGSDPTEAEDLLAGRYDYSKRAPAGADPSSLQAVESLARAHGLTIVDSSAAERRVTVRGTAAQMGEVFGTNLSWFESAGGRKYLSYEGAITVPAEIAPNVLAVLGLDQRPVAAPR